ncbi:uncharacterized protein LOC112340766 isoform X2 [Selaginella moellendorffii]|uniref:uncharacterized protein LOC112340766 isoform X2 n=1 Tax=Selaginella moellendorffii TaxID=88036 RepID=UPI000D1CE463|nr:uncharacterized protein LOC112340766 isoform X2 [Selaginella moellendorffii]|eukprot:XP_024515506.1 uncharacterized protein LOC112340766 isoform X2 [Selaginella moellendorffii]
MPVMGIWHDHGRARNQGLLRHGVEYRLRLAEIATRRVHLDHRVPGDGILCRDAIEELLGALHVPGRGVWALPRYAFQDRSRLLQVVVANVGLEGEIPREEIGIRGRIEDRSRFLQAAAAAIHLDEEISQEDAVLVVAVKDLGDGSGGHCRKM